MLTYNHLIEFFEMPELNGSLAEPTLVFEYWWINIQHNFIRMALIMHALYSSLCKRPLGDLNYSNECSRCNILGYLRHIDPSWPARPTEVLGPSNGPDYLDVFIQFLSGKIELFSVFQSSCLKCASLPIWVLTEAGLGSHWRPCHQWLHWKFSICKLLVRQWRKLH